MKDSVFSGRTWRVAGGLVAVLAALALAPTAQARGHVYWSIGVGMPVYGYGGYGGGWGGGWGGYNAWGPGWGWNDPGWNSWGYAPPVVVQAPPQRIEVQNLPLGPAPPSYWYYCSNPAGYYPQIATCPSGWAQVLAQPPAPGPKPAPAR